MSLFSFRRKVIDSLDSLDMKAVGLSIQADKTNRYLRTVMSNQEVFDSYAAKIAEQNNQIKSAIAVIISEIGKLQKAASAVAEKPLDTSKMDAAIEQLTSAVDEVEAIPAPVVEEAAVDPTAPVEVSFNDLGAPTESE